MKKILIPALATLLLLASACSQKSEYTNALPMQAETIIAIQPAKLADKAELDNASLQKLKDLLKKDTDATLQEYYETLLDDPAQSGIDFDSPIYLFNIRPAVNSGFIAAAKVADEANVQTLVDALQKQGLVSGTTSTDGGYTLTEGKLLMAYNASTLLMLGAQQGPQVAALKDSIASWMQQTEAQSFASRPEFKQLQQQTGDIKAIYSYASLPKSYKSIAGYQMPKGLDLTGLKFIAGLSFEKGSIDLHLAYHTDNEQIKSLLDKQNQVYRPVKNTFIDYFPQSTLLLASVGVNGSALYDLLLEVTPMGEELSAKDAETVKQLLGMFENDFTLGMVNFNLDKLPSLLAYATVKDGAPLKALLNNPELKKQLGRGNDIVQLEEYRYVWKSRNFNLFFGVQDKQFYATNDELLYKNLFKKCDPSVAQNAYAADMKGKSSFAVIDMEAVCQLPIVKMLAGMGGNKYATAFAAIDGISYLKSESSGETVSVSLQLKDKETNALKQIVELAKAAL